MHLRRLRDLIRQANLESGGSALIMHVGELVALEVLDAGEELPAGSSTTLINPYSSGGPDVDEIVITSPWLHGSGHVGDYTHEYVRARVSLQLSPRELETYRVMRSDGLPVPLAYAVAQALERRSTPDQ